MASPKSLYRPELDWLRFLAFLAVFLHHAVPHEPAAYAPLFGSRVAIWIAGAVLSGGYGVDLFLTLSAFLITDLLLREREQFGSVRVGAFYVRRLLRIWPLYFAFLGLTVLLPAVSPTFTRLPSDALLAYCVFLGNWFCAAHTFPGTIADPMWSISIEEQFYLAWPPLLVRVRHLLPVVGILLLLSTAVRIVLVWIGAPHPAIWCNTLSRLDPIACGIALAAARSRLPNLGPATRLGLVGLGCAVIVVCGRYWTFSGPTSLIAYPAVALSSSLLLLGFLGLTATSGWFRGLAYLGKISYGLYVFHILAIRLAARMTTGTLRKGGLALFLTIAMAAVSYELLEAPFLRLKSRFTRVESRPV